MNIPGNPDNIPCQICNLSPHRYGTTDPYHHYDAMACVNMLLPRLKKVEAERDAYRATLLNIAHLEDSPAAGANIAARTLNEWRGDRDPVVAGPWPTARIGEDRP